MSTGVGIDIGSLWIKVVQVQVSGKNLVVTGALKIPNPHADAVAEGTDETVPGAKGKTNKPDPLTQILPTLGEALIKAGIARKGLIGLTGREVNLRYFDLPPMPPARIKLYIDMQIQDKAPGGKKEDVSNTYDYRILSTPAGLNANLTVMSGIVRSDYLNKVYASGKQAGLTFNSSTPSAFGLVQTYLRTQKVPPGETVVLCDVGHENIEMAILFEQNVYFARSSLGGGKKFEAALEQSLKMGGVSLKGEGSDRIRSFKEERARLFPEGEKLNSAQELQVQKSLAEGADGIAGAIRAAVMFCRTQAKLPKLDYQRVYLSGGGARLKGLKEYLEQKSKRPVQVLDLYSSLDLRKMGGEGAKYFDGEIPDMAVAVGLAALDADPSGFHFKLLPENLQKSREFWGKTAFAAAGAVVLMSGLYLPYSYAQSEAAQAQAKMATHDAAAKKQTQLVKDFNKRQAALQQSGRLVDYYARQSRSGQIYLKLFAQIRDQAPEGMYFTYIGPPSELGTTGAGTGQSSLLTDPATLMDSLTSLMVRGYYESDKVTDPNTVHAAFFKKLQEVPGVNTPSLDLNFNDKDMSLPPGLKGFQFTIPLAGPNKPLTLNNSTSPAQANGAAPATEPKRHAAEPITAAPANTDAPAAPKP